MISEGEPEGKPTTVRGGGANQQLYVQFRAYRLPTTCYIRFVKEKKSGGQRERPQHRGAHTSVDLSEEKRAPIAYVVVEEGLHSVPGVCTSPISLSQYIFFKPSIFALYFSSSYFKTET